MPNLVQELGASYFNEFFNGALFLHENRIMQVSGVGSRGVTAYEYGTDNSVNIPNDFFQGYKTFEYPVLGYRRIGPNTASYLSRKQSTVRGIRPSTIHSVQTPASNVLNELGVMPYEQSSTWERRKVKAAFHPEFDVLATELPRLLSGEKLSLVLSPNIVIEPAVDRQDDWYAIYYKQAVIGKMNNRGTVTWSSSAHQNLLPELAS